MKITLPPFVASVFFVSVVVVGIGTGCVTMSASYSRREALHLAEQNERQHRAHAKKLDEESDAHTAPTNRGSRLRSAGTAHQFARYEATGYSHGCACERLIRLKDRTECRHSQRKRPGADGRWPVPRLTVAASRAHPFGTRLEMKFRPDDEFSFFRVVGDRGGDIGPGRVDLFEGTCGEAAEWERRPVFVRVAPEGVE